MSIERKILVSLLSNSINRSPSIEDIVLETRIPEGIIREVLFKTLKKIDVFFEKINAGAQGQARLKIALRAVDLGADIERVCSYLRWSEFEEIAVKAFESNDYLVKKNFRFTGAGRRWEIDVVAAKKPLVISTDCKLWHRGWRGKVISRVAKKQDERTKALAESSGSLIENMGIVGWDKAVFVPLILSLLPSSFKFYFSTPIVPVFQLREFLHEMPAHLDEMNHYSVKLSGVHSLTSFVCVKS